MTIRATIKFAFIFTLLMLVSANIYGQKTRKAAGQNWKTYDLCQNTVKAAFPTPPVEDSTAGSFLGKEFTTASAKVNTENGVFMVTCADNLPFNMTSLGLDLQKTFFEAMMKDFAAQLTANMKAMGYSVKVTRSPIKGTFIDSHVGLEQNFTVAGFKGVSKIIFVENRAIWSMAMLGTETRRANFFNSLRFTE